MITGCIDGYVRLWDIRTGRNVEENQVQKTPVTAMAAHPRIPILACSSHAQSLKVSRVVVRERACVRAYVVWTRKYKTMCAAVLLWRHTEFRGLEFLFVGWIKSCPGSGLRGLMVGDLCTCVGCTATTRWTQACIFVQMFHDNLMSLRGKCLRIQHVD